MHSESAQTLHVENSIASADFEICRIGAGILDNYPEKCPVRIWKRNIPLLIDLLISNNFSSVTFYCATRILRVIGRQSI